MQSQATVTAWKTLGRGACLAAPLTVLLASHPARAGSTEACLSAYEHSQELRLEGKYRAAREQLTMCVEETCPSLVRKDCSQWLGDLDASTPSVIINARDVDGKDLGGVRVRVDGAVVLEKLDGKPHPIDPGVHVFRYELEGFDPTEESVVIQQGEKNRVLLAKLRRQSVPAAEPTRNYAAAGALAGVGAVGVLGFAYFALTGVHDRDDLYQCAPNCRETDVDRAKTKILVANVSLGVGLVSLAGAAYFWFQPQPSNTALQVGARPIVGGAETRFRIAF